MEDLHNQSEQFLELNYGRDSWFWALGLGSRNDVTDAETTALDGADSEFEVPFLFRVWFRNRTCIARTTGVDESRITVTCYSDLLGTAHHCKLCWRSCRPRLRIRKQNGLHRGRKKRSQADDLLSCNRSQSYDSLRHHCRGRTRTLVLRRMPFSIVKPAPEKNPPSMISVLVWAIAEASPTRSSSLGVESAIRSGAERICACQQNKPRTIFGCNCATEPENHPHDTWRREIHSAIDPRRSSRF